MIRKQTCFILLVIVSACAFARSSHAGFVISATGGTVQAGSGTLTVPISITSTSGSSGFLGSFTLRVNITKDPTNPLPPVSSLEFISPTSYSTDPTLNDPRYVFFNTADGNSASFKYDTQQTFGQASSPGTGFFTVFGGSDIQDGTIPGTTISAGQTYHLANLIVRYTARQTTNASGDLFDVNLDLANSSFQDPNGQSLAVSAPTGVNPALATVRVTAQGVPEPSSLALVLCGTGFLGLTTWLRPRADRAAT